MRFAQQASGKQGYRQAGLRSNMSSRSGRQAYRQAQNLRARVLKA